MTLTKEWLQKAISDIETMRDEIPFGLDEVGNNTLQALKLALAGMEAKPVIISDDMAYAFHHDFSDSSLGADEVEEIKTGLRAAFANVTAPQPLTTSERAELENYRNAQQVVPGDITGPLEHAYKELTPQFMRNHISVFERYGTLVDGLTGIQAMRIALDVMERRAAMQSGAVKDGWVACSERMPHIGVPVITCCGDVVQYAAYAWDGKEWQDWYEEYDKLPASTFTHWHPRPEAPQQEV